MTMKADRRGRLLGLARRGGFLALGDRATCHALQLGRAKLVVVAGDAGTAIRRRVCRLAELNGVPLVVWGNKALLGMLVGRPECAVLALKNSNLARGFMEASKEEHGGEADV